MTWLELIDELSRQPLWLLKKDVQVCWDDLDSDVCGKVPNMDVAQLVCPTNEFEDPSAWTQDSGCYMAINVAPRERETDKTYTCTFTRAQMRESAAALGHVLTDEQCDTLAGYASIDVVDEARMEGYLSFGMQN